MSQVSSPSMDEFSYAAGKPDLVATLKQECSDFKVQEHLGFELSGTGDHLWLQIRKTDLSTTEVAQRLAKTLHLPDKSIGFSGMKDKRAETSQWFSLKTTKTSLTQLDQLEDSKLQILQTKRNFKKLSIGSHRTNRFNIVLRNCTGDKSSFEKRLETIAANGVPNYFGSQRFGRSMSNVEQVSELMREALLNQQTSKELAREIGRIKRGRLFSAARAYVFNHVLSERIALGQWSRYIPGDVMSLNNTSRFFAVERAVDWDTVMQQRLASFDIHPTGPLIGKKESSDKYASWGKAADIEDKIISRFAELEAGLIQYGVALARRSLRFKPQMLSWSWSQDESNLPALILEFELPKGAYATSLLRELCITN